MSGAASAGTESLKIIFTIGHSTRSVEELISILKSHSVAKLVDVRTVPGSSRNPQFNRVPLEESLREAGIAYLHMKSLGGLRRPLMDSPNGGWRNASFRGFADYMQTDEFARAVADLLREAFAAPTAIMCAEAVPWRCHRSLIADALLVRGVAVEHILGPGPTKAHALTPFAVVEGTRVTYPGGPGDGTEG